MNERRTSATAGNEETAPADTERGDASSGGDHTQPVLSRLSAVVGRCYTVESIARELGVPEAQVNAATAALQLLALRTADDHLVYPALQLDNGDPLPGLREVLHALRDGIDDPWTWALWLLGTPTWADGSDKPRPHVDSLVAGNVDGVVRAARHVAAAWSGP